MKYFKLGGKHSSGEYTTYWKWDSTNVILSTIERRTEGGAQEFIISSSYAYDEEALDSVFNFEEILEQEWDRVRLTAIDFIKDSL